MRTTFSTEIRRAEATERESGQAIVEYTMVIGTVSVILVGSFVAVNLVEPIGAQVARIVAHIGIGT